MISSVAMYSFLAIRPSFQPNVDRYKLERLRFLDETVEPRAFVKGIGPLLRHRDIIGYLSFAGGSVGLTRQKRESDVEANAGE